MPDYDFSGQVAFVTGAARGQGRAHAVQYAKHGADVAVIDVCETLPEMQYDLGTEDELEETAQLVEDEGADVVAAKADIRDEDAVSEAIDRTVDELGKLDILANNAGIWHLGFLAEMDKAMFDEMIETNLTGQWVCAKHAARHMKERGEGGKIISTGSTSSKIGNFGAGHYTAAKHGLRGLTKTMAIELGENDINVNMVCPGGVDAGLYHGMLEAAGDDHFDELFEICGKWNLLARESDGPMQPEEVSEAYMWLSSEAADNVTGQAIYVDGGFTIK